MYRIDGKEVDYPTMLRQVLEALEEEREVSYAYHQGTDCYWIDEEHPWYSKPIYIDDEGLKANGRLVEPVQSG